MLRLVIQKDLTIDDIEEHLKKNGSKKWERTGEGELTFQKNLEGIGKVIFKIQDWKSNLRFICFFDNINATVDSFEEKDQSRNDLPNLSVGNAVKGQFYALAEKFEEMAQELRKLTTEV